MSNQVNDPWATADSPKEIVEERHYFGHNQFDIYHCVLQKGEKQPPQFDPAIHKEEQKRTCINLTFWVPVLTKPIERRAIAERLYGRSEWLDVTLPSIHKLGLTPRDLHDKWCHIELVTSGSYVDKTTGENKNRTMPVYLAVYGSEQEATAAANSFFGKNAEELPFDPGVPAQNGNLHPAAANEPNLATVTAFVNILAPQATDETDLQDRLNKAGLKWESANVQQALTAYRATKQVA